MSPLGNNSGFGGDGETMMEADQAGGRMMHEYQNEISRLLEEGTTGLDRDIQVCVDWIEGLKRKEVEETDLQDEFDTFKKESSGEAFEEQEKQRNNAYEQAENGGEN